MARINHTDSSSLYMKDASSICLPAASQLPCQRLCSPMTIMGVPCDSINATMKLRIWRARSATTPASPVPPSAPQFQEKLSLVPSLRTQALS